MYGADIGVAAVRGRDLDLNIAGCNAGYKTTCIYGCDAGIRGVEAYSLYSGILGKNVPLKLISPVKRHSDLIFSKLNACNVYEIGALELIYPRLIVIRVTGAILVVANDYGCSSDWNRNGRIDPLICLIAAVIKYDCAIGKNLKLVPVCFRADLVLEVKYGACAEIKILDFNCCIGVMYIIVVAYRMILFNLEGIAAYGLKVESSASYVERLIKFGRRNGFVAGNGDNTVLNCGFIGISDGFTGGEVIEVNDDQLDGIFACFGIIRNCEMDVYDLTLRGGSIRGADHADANASGNRGVVHNYHCALY